MNGTTKIVLVVTVFFVATSLGILLGLADGLAEDGRVDRPRVLRLLGTGWLLATILVVVAMNARRWWPKILLIFCSTISVVLLSEAVVRLWLPAQYSKARVSNLGVVSRAYHHLQPPNADMFLGVFEGTPVFLQTNADGLRSHHSPQEFSRFTDRIVVLGDSFVFGLGVRQEYTFPEVMESVLRGRLGRQDVAVLNAGQVGYSPYVENLFYSGELIKYDATLVLLFLDTSDIGDDIRYQDLAKHDGEEVYFDLSGPRSLGYYGAAYELVRPAVRQLLRYARHPYERLRGKAPHYAHYDYRIEVDGAIETDRFFIYRYPLEKTRPFFVNVLENVGHIADSVQGHGARFVLVVFPRYHHWNPEESPDNWEAELYPIGGPYQFEHFRFFDELKLEVDYEILSLLPMFQESDESPMVFAADPHWNERGHAFVAEAMADYLVTNRLLE